MVSYNRLDAHARRLHSNASRLRGSKLTCLLDRCYHLPIFPDDAVSLQAVHQQVEELREELTAATVELSLQQDKIDAMTVRMNELLRERDTFINFGQVVEHVGVRQQRRKLSHFRDATDAALWFAESFGLIPESITVRTVHSSDQVTIPLTQESAQANSASIPKSPVREVDEFVALQTLYLMDRFGVSDECYHEITQVCFSISKYYCEKILFYCLTVAS